MDYSSIVTSSSITAVLSLVVALGLVPGGTEGPDGLEMNGASRRDFQPILVEVKLNLNLY
jgi:hypothetical protein